MEIMVLHSLYSLIILNNCVKFNETSLNNSQGTVETIIYYVQRDLFLH